MTRCYTLASGLLFGLSFLTACGGVSNSAFAPHLPVDTPPAVPLNSANGCAGYTYADTYTRARPLRDVLYNFRGGSDAEYPCSGLLAGKNGEYYGTSAGGGATKCYLYLKHYGCGTVYEITAAGKEKVLYSFQTSPEGWYPSPLIMDGEGALYGTTEKGGKTYKTSYCYNGFGCGIVFKLTPGKNGWTQTVLFEFEGNQGGRFPVGALHMNKVGALVGVTEYGGSTGGGDGVAFELTPSGSPPTYTETVIHGFEDYPDGLYPAAGLVSDSRGNLYGTTVEGGFLTHHSRAGWGTVYELTPSGSTYNFSVIYRFKGGADGKFPHSSLLPGPNGVFYGTTDGGATKDEKAEGYGTVFELVRDGKRYRHEVLYAFKGGSDGSDPDDTPGLVADRNGNLYGTTVYGGGSSNCASIHRDENGCGTVFKLTRSGKGFSEKVLYAFQGGTYGGDAAYPLGGVVIDNKGNLLGPTQAGGRHGYGTIFSIAP